jgi:hypothetical protein
VSITAMAMNDCAVDIANAALRAIHEKREMMPVLVTCGRIHSGKLSKTDSATKYKRKSCAAPNPKPIVADIEAECENCHEVQVPVNSSGSQT